MTELATPPAVFLRKIQAARAPEAVGRLSRLLKDAEALAKNPDEQFQTFFAFLGRLAQAADADALGALMDGPGKALIAALDAEFCRGCHHFRAGQCVLEWTPSIDGCC